jgi:hypothetical protein
MPQRKQGRQTRTHKVSSKNNQGLEFVQAGPGTPMGILLRKFFGIGNLQGNIDPDHE